MLGGAIMVLRIATENSIGVIEEWDGNKATMGLSIPAINSQPIEASFGGAN
jgi:hypothetical protein